MIIIFIVLVFFSTSIPANDRSQREALDKVYIFDKVRIFYTLNGENALPAENRIDDNHNTVPDYVEKIATNLKIADAIFNKTFGFTQPLNNDRYRGNINFIDVHIMATRNFKGVTGDKNIEYKYKKIKNKGNKSIDIKLSNKLDNDTLTPMHEFFHLYQNGYSMFKNKWYKEGLARWIEYAFEEGVGEDKVLPETEEKLEKLLVESYGAKYFWNRLTLLCDTNKGVFEPPPEIEPLDNLYIVRDHTLHGYEFIKYLLENLKKSSLRLAKDMGYSPYNWEDNQKSDDNNKYILCAVKKTLLEQCKPAATNVEIQNFLQTLDNYTEQSCTGIF